MQHQRRQRELINHLRHFRRYRSKRRYLYEQLGDNHRAGGNRLGNGAEKLDELVGLLKVNAARSRYFT
jgi:hypothetical protein